MTGFLQFWRMLLPLVVLSLIAPAGCLPVPPECRSDEVVCIGFVTDSNGLRDYGMNEQTWLVLQTLREEGVVVDVIESIDQFDYRKNLAYFSDHGYDLVISGGYDMKDLMLEMAHKYEGVSYLLIGQAPPEEDAPPNLAGIVFPEAQAGLWAGGLAAHFSEAKLVGAIFASRDIPSVGEYARGFELGVDAGIGESVVQAEVVAYPEGRFASSLSDVDWGELQAENLYARGTDVLFAYGGSTGISALEQFRGQVIGVEVDLGRRFPSMQERLVASIVFDLSILKEIGAIGKISQPVYQGGYQVLWGKTPAPEVLELLGEIGNYETLPVAPTIEAPEDDFNE